MAFHSATPAPLIVFQKQRPQAGLRQIREKHPTFPVIYLTASAVEEWSAQGVPNSILKPKPFGSTQIVTVLSRLLSGEASIGR